MNIVVYPRGILKQLERNKNCTMNGIAMNAKVVYCEMMWRTTKVNEANMVYNANRINVEKRNIVLLVFSCKYK